MESQKEKNCNVNNKKKGEKLDLEKVKGRSRDLIWR